MFADGQICCGCISIPRSLRRPSKYMNIQLRDAVAGDSSLVFEMRRLAFQKYLELDGGWNEAHEQELHIKRFGIQRFRLIVFEGLDVGYAATAVYGQIDKYPPSFVSAPTHASSLVPIERRWFDSSSYVSGGSPGSRTAASVSRFTREPACAGLLCCKRLPDGRCLG